MKTRLLLPIAAVMAAVIIPALAAQSAAEKKAAVTTSAALTPVQALPLTCAEAWIASQKNYDQMRAVIVTLAKVSLVNRDLTIPNNREAGLEAGKGIAADCTADPNALLFAVVDKQVRRIGVPAKR